VRSDDDGESDFDHDHGQTQADWYFRNERGENGAYCRHEQGAAIELHTSSFDALSVEIWRGS
jgi:hypothetical protein